ncbi:flagellar protein FliT [Erwinia aphidicola]|uniref:flagellar protein FliT n=1 Tax=Erwinia aphidicola TaxID=68334 RepID=UPI001654634A
MDNTLTLGLQKAARLNRNLMALTRQGKWDEFIDLMTEYASQLSEVVACDRNNLNEEEQSYVRLIIAKLIANEELMMQRMRSRLDTLRSEMTTLNKGKAASNAYAAPFTSLTR